MLTMVEYIERKAALEAVCKYCCEYDAEITECICNERLTFLKIPIADVAPVRHGRWERIGIKGRKALSIYPCCSACGMASAAFRSEWEGLRGPWKYCPNCGAKMDGKSNVPRTEGE